VIIKKIEHNFIPKEDFKIDNFTLLNYESINSLFINQYNNLPFLKRINEIKKTLVNTLKQNKNQIIEEVIKHYDYKIDKVRDCMQDCPERRKLIIKLTDSRDLLIKKILKESKTIVKEYISKCVILSPVQYYMNFLNDTKLFNELCCEFTDSFILENLRVNTMNNLNQSLIEIEDLAPIMYIKFLVGGLDEKITIRHVVIDEAQDFSPFQLYVIKTLIGGNSFTILGDLCQGIYSYRGITDWKKVSQDIFGKDNYSTLTLEQSYRTTIEIMEAASSVIKHLNDPNLPTPKPVIRHGEPVQIIEKSSLKDISLEIADKIINIKSEGFKSIAIICKTSEECKRLKAEFKTFEFEVDIITGNEAEYKGGVVLIPSYLVKGLEFDVVIVANGSKEIYSTDPLEVKLLYIAMTRPLHRLYIYSHGERAEVLSECDKEK